MESPSLVGFTSFPLHHRNGSGKKTAFAAQGCTTAGCPRLKQFLFGFPYGIYTRKINIMTTPSEVPSRVRELATVVSQPKAIRRGSLSHRTVKCSKPGCACGRDPKARHGPYYSLTRAVKGKTHSRFLSLQQAEIARQQIEGGRRFREQLNDYWEACEEWADAQLQGPQAAYQAATQEGDLQQSSESTSPKKSRLC